MSFITNNNRIYVSDDSGNVKFDTNRKYPFLVSSVAGSETFTNTVTSQTVQVQAGESFTSSTAFYGSEIDSTRILTTSGVNLKFCFAAITLTAKSNVAESPGGAYYFYSLPVNRTYAINGSLLVELQIASNGRVMRAAQLTCYVNAANQVLMHFKRTGYNNDVSAACSFTFNYNIQFGAIT
jgi:hypothetical protein